MRCPENTHHREHRGAQRSTHHGSPLWSSVVSISSYFHRLPHLPHGLLRHLAGARIAVRQHLLDDTRAPRELGTARTDGREVGEDVLDHDLLALETADAGRAAAVRNVLDLLRRAIDLVQAEGRTIGGIA